MAAVVVTVVETLILVSTKEPGRSEQQQERDRHVLDEALARDKRSYARARQPRWVETAPATDLFRTWGDATGWRELDTDAAAVADRLEERLAALYPEAMNRYRHALDAGDGASLAMARAAQVLASAPQATAPATTDGNRPERMSTTPGMVITVPAASLAITAHRGQMRTPARRR
jgi:hypothetical protein